MSYVKCIQCGMKLGTAPEQDIPNINILCLDCTKDDRGSEDD